jgi:GNAT superfamily N-acetyltransferase
MFVPDTPVNSTASGDVVIRELTPELLGDYLTFFDQHAFADNPRWAGCYCYFNHAPHHLQKWDARAASENRAAACSLIQQRQLQGYLAYVARQPCGWCCAGPREQLTTLPAAAPSDERIAAIACFVIAKPFRGRGLARQLLAAACDGLAAQGFDLAEAYPRPMAAGEAAHHHGPLALYLSAGFQTYRSEGEVVTVRKKLRSAGNSIG